MYKFSSEMFQIKFQAIQKDEHNAVAIGSLKKQMLGGCDMCASWHDAGGVDCWADQARWSYTLGNFYSAYDKQ